LGGNTHLGSQSLEISNMLFHDLLRKASCFFYLGKSISMNTYSLHIDDGPTYGLFLLNTIINKEVKRKMLSLTFKYYEIGLLIYVYHGTLCTVIHTQIIFPPTLLLHTMIIFYPNVHLL